MRYHIKQRCSCFSKNIVDCDELSGYLRGEQLNVSGEISQAQWNYGKEAKEWEGRRVWAVSVKELNQVGFILGIYLTHKAQL